ncbi:MAG TPA: TetR/AcrR family transcriptional regulator [Solirubrobacteraceae bacterium]|jgi:AcrR family transcriptional regulator
MPRRSAAQVDTDRALTLRAAVDLASVVGLEGLTIGRLAEQLGMSKSGLAGRFDSKEQLQLAALDLAVDMFRAAVYEPAAVEPAGRARLLAICDRWIDYVGEPAFPGGCFLTTASVEFDARRGAVHDAVKLALSRWLRVLEAEAATAVAAGELPSDTDPAEVAFVLNALAVGTNCDYQLHHKARALDHGRRAMAAVLRQPATSIRG